MDTNDMETEVSAAHAPIKRGRRLGRYVLCYELASGGMATVYLGRSEGAAGFEKLVALKVIHPHLAKEPEFVEMFLDEARIASRIQHPNVCSVFDFGNAEETYYLAMEYLVGENAYRMLQMLARSAELAADPRTSLLMAYIIQLACEGLHAAHEARGDDGELLGVVHRDMTPQNLFVGFDGSVRVVDFGIASGLGRVHQTTVGMLKGKYAYMSPEQIQQQPLDRRSDVWSLGVTLWEMLTRRRLFRRNGEYETLNAVLDKDIPKPSEVRPELDPELDEIVMRALTRDPEARFASARELGRALGRYVSRAGGATMADVADLMEALFPDERASRSVLVEKARKMDPEHPSTSGVVPAPSPTRGLDAPPPTAPIAMPAEAALPQSAPPDTAPPDTAPPDTAPPDTAPPDTAPQRGRAVGVATLIALAALGALAVGWFALGAGSPQSAQSAPPPSQAAPLGEAARVPERALAPVEEVETRDRAIPPPDPVDTDQGVDEAPAAPTPRTPRSGSAHAESTPRPEAPERPVTGIGSLNVVTPPGWADIEVDGEPWGRSPITIRLPAGTHRIRLSPYGEGPAISRRVRIAPGETERLVVRLDG